MMMMMMHESNYSVCWALEFNLISAFYLDLLLIN